MPARRIFVFTLHKCASMLLHKVGLGFSRAVNMRYVSPNPGGVLAPLRSLFGNGELLSDPGCYCPIRIPMDIQPAENTSIVLHLRDPRDALVSMYYSYCYSHRGEIAGNTGYRKKTAEMGIDHFVLSMAESISCPVRGDYGTGSHLWDIAGNYAQRYRNYVRNFIGKPGVLLLRYEDMVEDFEMWLTMIAGPFGLSEDSSAFRLIVADESPAARTGEEDKWSHKRKITPGDHLGKLRPETVARLDEVFSDCLDPLGYA